jgi:hypothetical protein
MATGDNLVLGVKDQVSNHTTSVTRVDATSQQHTVVLWCYASDKNSNGLRAEGTGIGFGVQGYCPSTGDGIRGYSDFGMGVYGEASQGGVAGVVGVGVPARKGEGAVSTVGVLGEGTYAGVSGTSEGHGVDGDGGNKGTGVYGRSINGCGVMGDCEKSGHAGAFFGNVLVAGDLDVQGAKGAAVPFPDGTVRRLYSMESPESWFEDFGHARLVRGRAKVTIDRGFGALIKGPYHVFVTPGGDSNGLYVTAKTRASFEVREQHRGTSSLIFSYRIVARRKDISGSRLAAVKVPARPKKRSMPAPIRRARLR